MRKKGIFQALLTGFICVFAFYAFQVLQGMYLTMKYVPDIAKAYESVDYLQNKVSFGVRYNPVWDVIEFLGLMLLGMLVYYMGRVLRRKYFSGRYR
ncbi:hypothetical protein [Paenibacillus eucommiae]|uniref:Menaquinol-cytochrome c reductase cytochrome b subunit n=1 Tax=Paenibacillus eucommiae TaxID=1355755 RepID=A0ABS4JAJ1_9BACL|nr:hypothetical protein [Paenibacillus eucommiae]MBP1996861.1 menaquinol-cytochrome c reductase cytochrome b subunit [Paenibacillus eucommiae]